MERQDIETFAQALAYYQTCDAVWVNGRASFQSGDGCVTECAADTNGPVNAVWSPARQCYIAVSIGPRVFRKDEALSEKESPHA